MHGLTKSIYVYLCNYMLLHNLCNYMLLHNLVLVLHFFVEPYINFDNNVAKKEDLFVVKKYYFFFLTLFFFQIYLKIKV
jgi:hypothetical protein